jgi:rhodanese-related sulfurtransferase
MIDAGVHVVDVRQPDEWNSGHIEQAELATINDPDSFKKTLQDLNLQPDEEVIFVCAGGRRSAIASEIASHTGMHKVYNLADGMSGWTNRNYPVKR